MHFINMNPYVENEGIVFSPPSIDSTVRFVRSMQRTTRQHPTKTIVACIQDGNSEALTTAALLLGSFIVLDKPDSTIANVAESFQDLKPFFRGFPDPSSDSERENLTVEDCWLALIQAKNLGWIKLCSEIKAGMDSLDLGSFDIEAYSHYAKALNGSVFTVVPGKVHIFPSPATLPKGTPWMDSGGQRHFSPAFYADLLSAEFDVFLVTCVDSADYDRAAFAERGVETRRLRVYYASHSVMVEPILGAFAAEVARVRPSPPRLRGRADDPRAGWAMKGHGHEKH